MPDEQTKTGTDGFLEYLDKAKPGFDSVASSDFYKNADDAQRERIKAQYWEWAKRQPEFRKIDQVAYKNYIFKQSFADQQKRTVEGGFMSGVGAGGELISKLMKLSEYNPITLPVVGAMKLSDAITGADTAGVAHTAYQDAANTLSEGAHIASNIGRKELAQNRPETTAGDIALKAEAGAVQGVTDMWKYLAAGSGGIPGFAALGVIEKLDPEKPIKDQWADLLMGGAGGALTGAFFEWAKPLKAIVKVPALGAFGFSTSMAQGAKLKDSVANAISLVLISLPGITEGKAGLGEKLKMDADYLKAMPKTLADKIEGASAKIMAKVRDAKIAVDSKDTPPEISQKAVADLIEDIKTNVLDDYDLTSETAAWLDKSAEDLMTKQSPIDIAKDTMTKEEYRSKLLGEEGKPHPATETAIPEIDKALVTPEEHDEIATTAQTALKIAGINVDDPAYSGSVSDAYRVAKRFPGEPEAVAEALGVDTGWSVGKALEVFDSYGNADPDPRAVANLAEKFRMGELSPESMKMEVGFPLNDSAKSDLRNSLLVDETAPGNASISRKLVDKAVSGKELTANEQKKVSDAILQYRTNNVIPYAINFDADMDASPRMKQYTTLRETLLSGGKISEGAKAKFPSLRLLEIERDKWIESAKTPEQRDAAVKMMDVAKKVPDNGGKHYYSIGSVSPDGYVEPVSSTIHTTVLGAFRDLRTRQNSGSLGGGKYTVISVDPSKLKFASVDPNVKPPKIDGDDAYFLDTGINSDAVVSYVDSNGTPRKWIKSKTKMSKDKLFNNIDNDDDLLNFTKLVGDDGPVPPTKTINGDPISRQDVVDVVRGIANTPVKTEVENVDGGQYKKGNRAIYLARSGDITVLAHEIGHNARETFGIDLKKYPELDAHGAAREEEFAEFIRLWLTNKSAAKREYGDFYKTWNSKLYGHVKELTDFFTKIRDVYNKYLQQPEWQKFLAATEYDPKEREKALGEMITHFGLQSLDQYFHIQKLARKYGADTNDLRYIYKFLHVLDSKEGAALKGLWGTEEHIHPVDLDGNIHKDITPFSYFVKKYNKLSFKDYISKRLTTNDDGKLFNSYIEALSMLHEGRDLSADEFENTFGVSRSSAEDMVKHVKQNPAKAKEYLEDAKKLRKLFEFVLEQNVKTGLISKKDAKAMVDKGFAQHAILRRVDEGVGSKGYSKPEMPDFFRERHGSSAKIISYMQVYKELIPRMMRTAFLNERYKAMAKFYDEMPEGAFTKRVLSNRTTAKEMDVSTVLEQIKSATKDGIKKEDLDNLIGTMDGEAFKLFGASDKEGTRYLKYYENGDPVVYQILDPEAHEQISMLRPEQYHDVADIVKLLTSPVKRLAATMRFAFTKNLIFPPFNLMRDTATRAVTTQSKLFGIPSLGKAVKLMMANDPLYEQFHHDFSMNGFSSGVKYQVEKELAKATGKTLKLTTIPAKMLDTYSEAFEIANRFSEYLNGIEKYGNTKEGRVKATWDALDVTLNFRMGGKSAKKINEFIPFFNAGVQELYKIDRALRGDKKEMAKFVVKGLLTSALLEFYSRAMFHNEDWYKNRSAFTRAMATPVARINGKTVWFPKPFAIGAIFSPIGELAEMAVKEHRLPTATEIREMAKGNVGVILPNMSFPIATIMLDLAANRDSFTGYQIEPESARRLPKRYRYSAYTPQSLIALGPALEHLKMSPAQADFILQRILGQYARWGETAMDNAMALVTGKKLPTKPKGGDIVSASLRRFVSYDWARMNYHTAKILEQTGKLYAMEQAMKDKIVGHVEHIRYMKENKWMDTPYHEKTVFALSDRARKTIYGLLALRSALINHRTVERKQSKYYRHKRGEALYYFLKENKGLYSPAERDEIMEKLVNGEQIDDQNLRLRLLNDITYYTEKKASSFIRQFNRLGVK